MKKVLFCFLVVSTFIANAQLLKGFNNPWFFGNFPSTGFYPPSSVINEIKSHSVQVLRFPGGHIANGYDVNKPGYGYPKESGVNYVYKQKQLADELGAKTIFVANMYEALTTTPDSQAYWIQNIVDAVKICSPAYVELGNELQIYPEITGVWAGDPGFFVSKTLFVNTVVASATRYVELCKIVMAKIRAEGLNPEFGMNMDQPFHTRGKTWNSVIRAWNGYDGEIFHIYLTTRDVISTSAAITKIIAGSIKPVWITEWAWVHGNGLGGVVQNATDIGMPYYNNFPNNFETACSRDSRIKIICRHQMYGNSVYSVIPDNIP